MSEVLGRKAYNIDQPAGAQIESAAITLALGFASKGKDGVLESEIVQVTSGQFISPVETISEAGNVVVV